MTEARDPLPDVPVVVLGLMGAGKTTLSRHLAVAWGRRLCDSDADLEEATGQTAGQIAVAYGLARLHHLESAHLLRCLLLRPPPVIAAAASVVDRAECREALSRAAVVWLDIPVAELVRRQASGTHRPSFGAEVEVTLSEMDIARRAHFQQLADVVLGQGAPGALVSQVTTTLAGGRPDRFPTRDH